MIKSCNARTCFYVYINETHLSDSGGLNMNKKGILILAITLAITSSAGQVSIVKAEDINTTAISKVIYAPSPPMQGITTNQLKPYVLNEKEIATVFGSFTDEIQKLRMNTGFYVFDNEKYGIKGTDIYVMVSLGARNTTGYGIKVVSVEDIEGISKITIQETKPQPDMMVGQAITYPYIIVKFAQGTPNVRVTTDKGEELTSLVNSLELKEKGWMKLKTRSDVPQDKEWLVTFKKDLFVDAIGEDTVYIRDSRGAKVPVELVVGDDKRSVKVVPIAKYEEGQTYYLFISNKVYSEADAKGGAKGYRMEFRIQGEVNVADPVKQEANAYIVSGEYENVPFYDAASNKEAGVLSQGFSLNLTEVKEDRVYFAIPSTDATDSGKSAQKDYYVPAKYLEKAYKEPFIIPMIISVDTIKIKENASIYTLNDGKKECIMKTSQSIGPLHFIWKTENGYQLVLANNLVYVQPEDVEFIKHNE